MEKLEIQPDSISQKISQLVTSVNFGQGLDVVPVSDVDTVEELKGSGFGLDYRSKVETTEKISSVFEGLAFDPDHVRSQAFALYENLEGTMSPVALMTFVIAPKKTVEEERYWEKTPDGLVLSSFEDIQRKIGNEPQMPDFVISPAWTKVDPKYLGRFAVAGFRVIDKVLKTLSDEAPENSYIEISAQGRLFRSDENFSRAPEFFEAEKIGTKIDNASMPTFTIPEGSLIDLFGQNTAGSNSTVKMAELLGITRVEGFADHPRLGPVFVKRAKQDSEINQITL